MGVASAYAEIPVIPDLIRDPATRRLPGQRTCFSPGTRAGWMPDQVRHDGVGHAPVNNQALSVRRAYAPTRISCAARFASALLLRPPLKGEVGNTTQRTTP